MRIGEVAALVGITTRAVRHYHHQGLLPEPPRRPNGYRAYGLRDAVELARIRRLTELGLALEEVRDVLADDRGRDLHEVLVELDADLARQERAIQERRSRLAVLLEKASGADLDPDDVVSPGLAGLFGAMSASASELPEPAPAAWDRELLALMDTTATPEDRERLFAAMRPMATDPGAVARSYELYRRLGELTEATADDPRIPSLDAEFADHIPADLLALLGSDLPGASTDPLGETFLAELPPAQAEVVRETLRLLTGRLS
ncbi:MerR family transcriptional regulator [Streptosporangium sp. NBC_01810]|uniref:MerR family transcriptional regulator n=1 Tax=Streptosporangium sp. NBC_01810 TaxID=2975951 RepID=UPI002DD99EF9|nr:MerR family transcriptional regulator [Streptosporangium sp. NBC_01810]WSA27740.1 MerR family transcriptional regulator [Streptosporangium sp. NBC_01810]